MTFKQFLVVMLAATLAVWLVWIFVLFNLDPTNSGWTGFIFFYIALWMAAVGTITLVATPVRRLFRPTDLVSRQVLTSFRQAVWLASLVIVVLILLSQNIFRLWIVLLFVIVFCLLELAFLTARRQHIKPPL